MRRERGEDPLGDAIPGSAPSCSVAGRFPDWAIFAAFGHLFEEHSCLVREIIYNDSGQRSPVDEADKNGGGKFQVTGLDAEHAVS